MVISSCQTSPLPDQKLLLPLGLAGYFCLAFTEVFWFPLGFPEQEQNHAVCIGLDACFQHF